MPLLVADDVSRTFAGGERPVRAVAGVSLSIERGEFVALVGPSGCGKSTLLHLCGAMDRPTSGTIRLGDVALHTLNDDELTRVRRKQVGFVFQFFNLLPTLTLLENVALPLMLAGEAGAVADSAARDVLDRVGLTARRDHFPQQVSGGEMQRAAIARALVHHPALIIADEPSGNLDSDNGRRVLAVLTELNRDLGVTLLLATHAADISAAASRVLTMRDGRLLRSGLVDATV
jgi:putative ABC transport system ATP-binding protein